MTSSHQPSFLAHLRAQDFEYLLSDLDLEAEGTVLHYVIDPKELIDYCFPDNCLRSRQKPSVSEVSDDQIALHNLFFVQSELAILLDEYAYELQSTVMGIKHSFQRGSRLLGAFYDSGRLEISSYFKDTDGEISRARAEEVIWKNLNVILAVAIGSHTEGFARLDKILNERLVAKSFPDHELDLIIKAFDDNRGSGLARSIYDKMSQHIVKSERRKERIENLKRTAEVDAFAIDRLLAINRFLEYKHARGDVDKRHLFLYLSGAQRSSIIFGLPEVISALPLVKGRPYGLLRARRQILLKLVALDETPEKTINNITRIRELVSVSREQAANAAELAEFEGSVLLAYQRKLEEHEVKIKNSGLASMLSRLEKYKALSALALSERDRGVEVIGRILRDPTFPDIAEMQRSVNIALSGFKLDFRGVLLSGLARLTEAYAGTAPFLRRGRDPVAGTAQYMPINLAVSTFESDYGKIIELIIDFYKTPPQGDERKARLIRQACQLFLERDLNQPDVGFGHEFVRTLLFLAVPGPESNNIAYEHAVEMLARLRAGVLHQEEGKGDAIESLEREFSYVACWAARRSGLYREAYSLASESIRLFPADPRFFHGRSLAIFSWMKEVSRLKEDPSLSEGIAMRLAVEDAEKAIQLYRQQDLVRNRDSIAALLNTLACYFCFRLDELYDVGTARRYLDELKRWSDKLSWFPSNPEYFHTEAFVEYEEFKEMWKDGAAMEDSGLVERCRQKLGHALNEIRRGITLYRAHDFVSLEKAIENSLQALPR